MRAAELVIHNAPFDVAFLDAELARLADPPGRVGELCQVLDTLALARQMHPGQRNGLGALCKRYSVDNSHRDLHGALLDADLLLEVYLAMTGGQGALTLDAEEEARESRTAVRKAKRPRGMLVVVRATATELQAHERRLAALDKASGGKTVWRSVDDKMASLRVTSETSSLHDVYDSSESRLGELRRRFEVVFPRDAPETVRS